MVNSSNRTLCPTTSDSESSKPMREDWECEAVVYFRTPHSRTFTRLQQHHLPQTAASLNDLPLSDGYLIMPFVVTDDCPAVFIRPDLVEEHPVSLPKQFSNSSIIRSDEAAQHEAYIKAFQTAHRHLLDHELQKIVLSRQLHLAIGENEAEASSSQSVQTEQENGLRATLEKGREYFLKACHYRPNSFVSFWWTRQTGAWLIATPEPLLEKHHHDWGTVALAGTLKWQPDVVPEWNEKNREEQAIVQRFILQQLQGIATDLKQSETYTLHTGNIQHLCTDFRFGLPSDDSVREVLLRLHPTPAVCGLPRCEARQAILHDEAHQRRYYAGFSGPVNLKGETHLYVSLRCMEFTAHTATLYAGGGIMPESNEQDEWVETQRKMQTMRQLFLADKRLE